MHAMIKARLPEIADLCRRLGIRRLDLFGSAVDESVPACNDIDVLAEFGTRPGFDHFGAYFGLKEGLEQILSLPVDVVSASNLRNPYFRERVMQTREPLFVT
jgi:uncharacterized protein